MLDTAGQEEFRTQGYYKQVSGSLQVYTIDDIQSLKRIPLYEFFEISWEKQNQALFQLLTNVIQNFTNQLRIEYIKTSAKTYKNVNEVLRGLVDLAESQNNQRFHFLI